MDHHAHSGQTDGQHVELERLEPGEWYWHEREAGERVRLQVAHLDVTDHGISVVTTDERIERCSYPRGWVVERAPDSLGPDGQERRRAVEREMGWR